jgi:hypothetical protein
MGHKPSRLKIFMALHANNEIVLYSRPCLLPSTDTKLLFTNHPTILHYTVWVTKASLYKKIKAEKDFLSILNFDVPKSVNKLYSKLRYTDDTTWIFI